jgi:pyridoxamine 5'-phosphate oxidase
MTMPDFTSLQLDELLDVAWSMLELACKDRSQPMHLVQVATTGLDKRPKVRTIVLRRADRSQRIIRFHTDSRSAKVDEIARNPFAEIHAYDPAVKIQVRMSGSASIHSAPEVEVAAAWNASRSVSRNCYRMEPGPGEPIVSGGDYTLPPASGEPDIGLTRFRTVVISIDAIEIVTLAHNANRRARFEFTGSQMNAFWLAP